MSAVGGQRRIDREVHAANHALMGPDVISAPDVNADDVGVGSLREDEQDRSKGSRAPKRRLSHASLYRPTARRIRDR